MPHFTSLMLEAKIAVVLLCILAFVALVVVFDWVATRIEVTAAAHSRRRRS